MQVGEELERAQISSSDYATVIQALFEAAPSRSNAQLNQMPDRRGSPVGNASISRNFDEFILAAENRGSTYAVWITETENGTPGSAILFFAEFPWGELNSVK